MYCRYLMFRLVAVYLYTIYPVSTRAMDSCGVPSKRPRQEAGDRPARSATLRFKTTESRACEKITAVLLNGPNIRSR